MAWAVWCFCAVLVLCAASAKPPHIILFVADDEGWANVQHHNPEHVKTPNVDSLLKEGIELDRHYVFWYCSPTRSSFMSGRLPMHVSEDNNNAGTSMGAVPVNMTMIPAKLKKAGYATHQVGKWHMGNIRHSLTPNHRGFDTSLGYLGGAEDHYHQTNSGCGCGGVDLWKNSGPAFGMNGTYGAYMYNKEALDIIESHDPTTPLFMYVALQNLHAPQQVPSYYSNQYSSAKYTDAYRVEQGMSTCADEVLGNVTAALKARKMWDNTLFVYSSDNGGPAALAVSGHNANNWPLRGGKHTAWEGGVRVNAFVTGGIVASQAGSKLEGYIHACDWYATFAKLAGVDPTDNSPGMPPIDSLDMWDYLTGKVKQSPRTVVPLVSGSQGALIVGDYKVVRGEQLYGFWQGPVYPNASSHKHGDEPKVQCGEGCLFNIKVDPTESNDLRHSMPQKLKEMLAEAAKWDATAFLPNRGKGNKTACCEAQRKNHGFSGPYWP